MGKNFVLFLFLYMNAVRGLQRFAFSLLSGIGLSHDKTCACPLKKFPMSAEKLCDVCRKTLRIREVFYISALAMCISAPAICISALAMCISGLAIEFFFLIKRTFSADIAKFFCRHRKLFYRYVNNRPYNRKADSCTSLFQAFSPNRR